MKTLADFKKRLQQAIDNPDVFIQSTLYTATGVKFLSHAPATVFMIRSDRFALKRQAQGSWSEFSRASEWTFTADSATRKFPDGSYITYNFTTKNG